MEEEMIGTIALVMLEAILLLPISSAALSIDRSMLLDCMERDDFACMNENSAELVIGINDNCFTRMKNLIIESRSELVSTISMRTETVAVVCEIPSKTVRGFEAEARSEKLLRYIEPKRKFCANSVPDDPYRDLQWALKKIEAYSAWNITTGNPQTLVAVVDTGVDYNHPDLAQNYVALGHDWVNNDTDPMDDNGHGTHCAGIIGAAVNNSIGIAGVAQIRYIAEKGLDQYGSGWSVDLANAIYHAVDQGAKIISCSWGGYEGSELIHDAIRYAHDADVLVVASAGNDAWDLKTYPAAFEEVIAVSATDRSDNPTGFTNFGDWVKLSAPGDFVFSTVPDSGYSYMSGTSMSTPHVAGVAALVWGRFPNMTRDQVVEQLFKTSDDLGDAGFDVHYGYGRINVGRAVEQAQPRTDVLIQKWQKSTTIYCKPEEVMTINATIFGFGTSDTSNMTSQMFINGSLVDSKKTEFLKSGESETVLFHWTPHLEGTYNATVHVVPASDESITDNNALTIDVRVRGPREIEVRQNYSIQEAIDSAYPGDTVKVEAGIYYEHLTISKSLDLVGGGAAVIDGNGTGNVVHVLADDVNVTGFMVQHGTLGICLNCSCGNTIANNTISNNSQGLVLSYSGNNKIKNNSMIDNKRNFCVDGDFDKYTQSQFVQDMDSSNTVDQKPIYYWVNEQDKQIPSNAGYVAIIDSTNITIRGLDLRGNRQGILVAYTENSIVENISTFQDEQGILLVRSSDCAIRSNVVANSDCGIDLRGSSNITVAQNTVQNNTYGIRLRDSSSSILQNNTIASNHENGIKLEYSSSNELCGNNVSNNSRGINLAWSGSSILRNNNLIGNIYSFGMEGGYMQDFILDIDTSNTVQGKPIYYLINKHNLFIDSSTSPSVGYLAVVNCTNISVKDLNLTGNSQGILLAYTDNSTIEKVSASDNLNGIYLFDCNADTVRDSVINSSESNGITLHSSTNNDIAHNTVVSSEEFGIYLSRSSSNRIKSNMFSESRWGTGACIEDSSRHNLFIENTLERALIGILMGVNEPHSNEIYYNNFVHNTNQVLDFTTFWLEKNIWDDGRYQGNYWSTYKGEDTNSDGIGDTLLPHLGIDNYPLMTKYWNEADINHDGKVDILDIAIVAKAFRSTAGHPNWNAKSDLDINGKIDIVDVALVATEYGKMT